MVVTNSDLAPCPWPPRGMGEANCGLTSGYSHAACLEGAPGAL